jgi:hypothetical protein
VSVQWKIPHQARFVSTANIFTATFNNPVVGAYDYGVAGNVNQVILRLQRNTVYLIERISVSGDISEENYTDALDLSVAARLPRLTLRKSQDLMSVYESAIPLPGYVAQQEAAVFVRTQRDQDDLTATVTGRLNQTAALVGRADVRLTVSFAIYAMESTIYNRAFEAQQNLDLGSAVRGA